MSVDKVPDFKDREEAIMTANHAFVWASAGTGKTQTLALRALYLLLNAPFFSQGEGEKETPMGLESTLYSATSRSKQLKAAKVIIRSLVLTTFTRKAAAEMQTRLYGYLDKITMVSSFSDLEAKNPDLLFLKIVKNVLKNLTDKDNQYDDRTLYLRLRDGAQVLGELAAELQISTIHSFASSILRRYPLQTGIPPKARFAREGDEDNLVGAKDQLVDYWWQRVVMENPKAQKELVSVAKVVPIDKISDWLKWSYQFPWIVEEAKNVPLDDQKQADQLVEAVQALVQALGHLNSATVNEVRNSLDQIVHDISSKKVGAWVKLCSLMYERKGYLFLNGSPNQGVKKAIEGLDSFHAQYFQSWTHFYSLAARICIAKQFNEPWKIWVKFLERFINWADGAGVRELELVTFDEMIQLAVKLLEENPRIRRTEQARLRAILVDEFQDTARTQLRLFQALLTKDVQDPHEVLGFFVGDKKQSIYGFRGSDVPVITDFHNNYQRRTGCTRPPESFHLKTNFRSTRQITDFTNYFFNGLVTLTDENDSLLPYRPDQKRRPEWIFIDKDTEGNELKNVDLARECAAYETLRIIQEYEDQPDTKYADILVLVRDNQELKALLPILQESEIPAVSVGAKIFYCQPEVLDVLNFLIVLLNPEDSLAVAAVLRSPFIYLSDPDIYALLKEISPNRLFHSQSQLPEFLPQQVEIQIKKIRQLVDKYKELTLTEWLQQVRNFIPLVSYSDSRDPEGRPIIRIDRLLGSFQREMEVGLMAPLVWLLKQRQRAESKWDSDFGEDINVVDESVNAVRVMTIHQAKGLQGRLVIVCGWAEVLSLLEKPKFPKKATRIYRLTDEKERLLQGFLLDWGLLKVPSADYPEVFRCKEQSLKDEEKRVAYVATTRACDRLVLVCAVTKTKERSFSPEIKKFINNAKESSISQTSAGHKTCGNTLRFFHRTPSKVKITSKTPDLPNLDPEYEKFWKERKAEWLDNPTLLLERPSDPESKQLEDTFEDHHYLPDVGTEVRLLTGRLVHDYLEQYLLEDQCSPQLLSQLASDIPGSQDRQDAVEEAISLLYKFYTGQLVDNAGIPYRERLRSSQILGREIPVYLAENGKIWNGVIDLVMEREDSIQAIDYKATEAKDPLPASYIQQQKIYTEALKRTFPGRPVTFEFWWLYV